jgi:phosphate transport system substrate-binding protein
VLLARTPLVLASLVALLVSNGCGGGSGPGGSPDAGQPVLVDGSSTVYRISVAAQEDFMTKFPQARVVIDNHGTGGGFGNYNKGEVDIVNASRPAKPEEEEQAKAKGYDWTRFLVGHDGITLAVNPKNDWADKLTVDQLRQIFEPNSKIQTWKDLNPAWPDRKIVLYTPDDDSGTYDFFVEEAILKDAKAQRKDVQSSSDDNTLITGIAGDQNALGYFGFAYYAANKDKLRALPIQNGPDAQPITPSPETIFAQTYKPLSRPLYIYVKNSSLKRREVADFVRFYIENLADLAQKAGYVAPTDAEQSENKATLAAALSPSAAPAGSPGETAVTPESAKAE